MHHLLSIGMVLWTISSHRRLLAASYLLLLVEAAINAAMPTLIGLAIQDCQHRRTTMLFVLCGGGVIWAVIYGVRAMIDTRAFEGALTEALIAHLVRAKPTAAEASATIKAAGLITVVLRYKVPRLVDAASLVAGAVVYITLVDWRLAILVVIYLVCQAWPIAVLSVVSERIGRLRNQLFDRLPAAIEARDNSAADLLRRIQDLEVRISDLDARMGVLQSLATTVLLAAAIAVSSYSGADVAAVTAIVIYLRGLGNATDAAGVVAQLAGEAKDAADRVSR